MSAIRRLDKIRFRGDERCPICGGCDDDPRGQGSRCHGWREGQWAYCSRHEYAGSASFKPGPDTYAHKLHGDCPCGTSHGPALTVHRKPSGRVEARYVYRDEDRKPLFRVVKKRLDDGDKTFYQQAYHPENGTYKGGLKGVRTVLYHLPELLAADPSKPVFIVEGEKDVENLESLGLVATSNPMGAEKWRDHYSDFLRGRRCVLVQDNDDPGRRHVVKVGRSLQGKAASVRVLELPGLAEHGDVSDWLKSGGTVDRLRELAEAAPEWEAPPGEPEQADELPIVFITPKEDEVAAEVVQALAKDPSLYVLAGQLATIVDVGEEPRGLDYGDEPPPQIHPLEAIAIRGRITANVNLVKIKKNRDGEDVAVHSHPPDWLAPMVHKRPSFPGIRNLAGIIEAPTIRRDGSILDAPGYDPATRLYFRPNAKFEPIPERPTRTQAEAARDLLLDLICDFPFRSRADRALWLTALLTVLARSAFDGPVPLFGFDGNCPGTGKTLLADLLAILATGRAVPKMAFPGGRNGDEEMDKRITSIALAGERMVLLDNVDEPLGGASLDGALTTTVHSGRLLGKNQKVNLPLYAVWLATGNNLQCKGDMLRRVLFARLESPVENPEERRDFKIPNLRRYVRENRGRLVSAALTIIRAWRVADHPPIVDPLGSFEVWSECVVDPIAWVTGVNPFDVRPSIKEADTEAGARESLVLGWAELMKSEGGLTVVDAITQLKTIGKEAFFPGLRAALAEISNNSELPSAKVIGKQLKKLEGRPISGLVLRCEKDRTKTNVWRVERITAGSANDAGSVQGVGFENSLQRNSESNMELNSVAGSAGSDMPPPRVRSEHHREEQEKEISPTAAGNTSCNSRTPCSYDEARFGVFMDDGDPAF